MSALPLCIWSMPLMKRALMIALPIAFTVPLLAQEAPQLPGVQDATRVAAGTYKVDSRHTQVNWQVNHFGFNDYFGLFGDVSGTLNIDPANPGAAKVDVTLPVASLATSNQGLTDHLKSADFFDAPKFAEARFVSTSVTPDGNRAIVKGDLTMLGVTRQVELETRFEGAGNNPMNKKATIGFHAATTIKRSDWGMTKYVPMVGDEVKLRISVVFEKDS
jgi:polyisoprenoid-binding protein YceI